MNKYQEALNWLRVSTSSKEHNERFELLQELVNKEVPMKPYNQYLIDFGLGNCGGCEVCNGLVNYQMAYCPNCGHRIDWSKNV